MSLEAMLGPSAQGMMPTGRGVQAKRGHVLVPALPPLTLVQGKAHVECSELGTLHKHLHALVATHLLICGGEPCMEEGTGASSGPLHPGPPSMPAWVPPVHPMSLDMETLPASSYMSSKSGEAGTPQGTPAHQPAASPSCPCERGHSGDSPGTKVRCMVRAKLFPSVFSLRMASRYLQGEGGVWVSQRRGDGVC